MERIAAAWPCVAQDGRNSVNSFAEAFADEAPQASFGQLFGQPASNAKGKTARPPVAAESPEKDAPGASFLLQSRQTQANVLADMKRTGAQNATFNGQPLDSSSTSVAARLLSILAVALLRHRLTCVTRTTKTRTAVDIRWLTGRDRPTRCAWLLM